MESPTKCGEALSGMLAAKWTDDLSTAYRSILESLEGTTIALFRLRG